MRQIFAGEILNVENETLALNWVDVYHPLKVITWSKPTIELIKNLIVRDTFGTACRNFKNHISHLKYFWDILNFVIFWKKYGAFKNQPKVRLYFTCQKVFRILSFHSGSDMTNLKFCLCVVEDLSLHFGCDIANSKVLGDSYKPALRSWIIFMSNHYSE